MVLLGRVIAAATMAAWLLTGALIASPQQSPTASVVGAAFDESRGRIVIVGRADTQFEMWERNGTIWSRVNAAGPTARDEALLVYDSHRKRLVLHGGRLGATNFNDTWSFEGGRWQPITGPAPSSRAGAAMVYDRRRDRVVLFGGSEGQTGLADTWEFDGARWTRRETTVAPTGRSLHGLAYDEDRGRVVLFGGLQFVNRQLVSLDDTWEWDGATWRQIAVAGIGGRDHVSMVYAPDRRAIVLQGGSRPDPGFLGDTWTYDGKAWRRLTESGPPRVRHRLVYDSAIKAVVLYGGWGPNDYASKETWTLTGRTWTQIR